MKRIITYLLFISLLLSVWIPAFAAETGDEETTETICAVCGEEPCVCESAGEEEVTAPDYSHNVGKFARFDVDNWVDFLLFDAPENFDFYGEDGELDFIPDEDGSDWDDSANWLSGDDIPAKLTMTVDAYYWDSVTTALWYKVTVISGDAPELLQQCAWVFQDFTDEELTGGDMLILTVEEPVFCEKCQEYECTFPHAVGVPEIMTTVIDSEGYEQKVAVSGEALPDGAQLVVAPIDNINTIRDAFGSDGIADPVDIKIYDSEGNQWQPAEGETVTVKFSVLDYSGNYVYTAFHMLDDPDAIIKAMAEGTLDTDDVSAQSQAFFDAFADEISAWQEATGSTDLCIAFVAHPNLLAANGVVEFETDGFSAYYLSGSTLVAFGASDGRDEENKLKYWNGEGKTTVYVTRGDLWLETGDGFGVAWSCDGNTDYVYKVKDIDRSNIFVTPVRYYRCQYFINPGAPTGYSFTISADGNSNDKSIKFIVVDSRTVNFYNGSTLYDTKTVVTDGTYTSTFSWPTNPSKTGYTFMGWSETNGGTSAVNTSSWAPSSATQSLYAIWTANDYTLTFNFNGGKDNDNGSTANQAFKVTYDSSNYYEVAWLNPVRAGYTFKGWYTATSGGTQVYGSNGYCIPNTSYWSSSNTWKYTNSLTVYAQWTANTDTPYTVKHYKQNLDGTYPSSSADTDNLTGTTDSSVTPAVKSYTGFTAPSTQTVTVLGDGSRVVNYYYTRNSYTVTVNAGTGISSVSGGKTYKYGDSVTINAVVKTGYTWNNWTGYNTQTDQSYTFNMPASNVTYTANATANPNTPYTVNHYKQNLDGTYPGTPTETDNLTGTTDSSVTPTRKSYTGFTAPAAQTVTVLGDGSRVVDYYYTRNSYTVTVTAGTGISSVSGGKTYKYGESVTVSAVVKEGYTWKNWTGYSTKTDQSFTFDMPAANVAYTATATPNSYTYNVEYRSQTKPDKILGSTTVTKEFDTTNTITPIDIDGYTTPAAQSVKWDSTTPKTIVFYYVPTTYTITIDKANGDALVEWTYTIEASDFSLDDQTPTRDGYTFLGWTGSNGDEPQTLVKIPKGSSGDRNYTAQWSANTYTLSFDPKGGTVTPTSKSVTYDSPCGDLPTPTLAGYEFVGWYTAGGTPVTAETVYTTAGNSTVNARWLANVYTVTYNANGGSVASPGKEVSYNGAYGELPTPTRDGYTFDGWYTLASGGVQVTASTTYTIVGNSTIYAHWTPNTYMLIFNANSGVVDPVSKTVTFNDSYGTLPTPTRAGYTFDGWYTGISDGTQVTADMIYTTVSSRTIYAHWTANSYTLSFNANGGTVSPGSKSVTYDSPCGELPTPSRDGYTFAGWYTAEEGGTQVTAATVYTTASSSTVYARWAGESYTLSFDANGGSVSPESMSVIYNEAYGTMPTPTRNGYDFDGWFTAVDGGELVTAETIYTTLDDSTVYAHWTAIDYTVIFKDYDDRIISEAIYHYGDTVVVPADPERAADGEYTYTFAGWSPDVVEVVDHATYTATYSKKAAAGSLTISAKCIDTAQTFIFVVSGTNSEGEVNLTVAVRAGSSVTIKDIPVGTYTVAEYGDGDWNWRYAKADSQVVTVVMDDNSTAQFTYSNRFLQWLSGYAYYWKKKGGAGGE